jgi:GH24 family phage-related lysozyme (muramidase)
MIMNSKKPSEKALNLLFKYEVGGGKNYYDKYLSHFTWPGGASGPTIGIGIDCAYYTQTELQKIFEFLPSEQIELIKKSSGKTGQDGKEYTKTLRQSGIVVEWEEAVEIFNSLTWKKFSTLAEKTFPSLDQLCPDAYGAIVSLVFNRGTSLNGPSRLEMRKIKELIPSKDYNSIANEIRKMKRLWMGKNMAGLLERRESEAKLVESCA